MLKFLVKSDNVILVKFDVKFGLNIFFFSKFISNADNTNIFFTNNALLFYLIKSSAIEFNIFAASKFFFAFLYNYTASIF